MNVIKIIAYIAAAISLVISGILILFGILFILGSGNPEGQPGWFNTGLVLIFIGIVLLIIGLAAILAGRKIGQSAQAQNVTLKVDLPANVSLDTMKCKSCGGSLTMDNIQMVAGAPVVNCPYCNSTYQLTEEPKW
jgi:hypothetical protein